ncbi:hypothetical protein D9Q98_005325 [Chlorella vulgaris]|uniref:Uncharacterized protein n=1 Tax=Chlorella vulgaris TaxID=3077 RepID=A0A9D4TLS6_CHLVU|nr:hypothetical protein D9Q98_005325 [Chlorella vulgaris]
MRATQEASAPAVRASASSNMGQLLLEGWAMLADTCPDCGVPLMRHPSGAPMLCVNCGRDFAAASAPAPQANGVDHSAGSSEADADSGILEAPPTLRSVLRPGLEAEHARADSRPARHGTHALTRSNLTSLREAIGDRPSTQSVDPDAAQLSGSLPSAQPPRAGQDQGQQHDASKAIAELMLDGWAMLAEHCPRCLHPLLRSRDRRTYCGGCQLYVVREGNEQARALPPPQDGPQLRRQRDQARAPPQQLTDNGSAPAAPAPIAPAPAPGVAPQHGGASAPVFQEHVLTVEAAAAVVATGLAASTARLAAADPTGAGEALAQVQQCASALQALADCRRSMGGA